MITIESELKKKVKVIRANNKYEVRLAISGGYIYKEIPIEKGDTEEILKIKAEKILPDIYNDYKYSHDTEIKTIKLTDEEGKLTGETQDVLSVTDKFKDNLPKEIIL